MNWDWKKAMGVGDGPQGTTATACTASRHGSGDKKQKVQTSGSERSPSIVWRPGGPGGAGLYGGAVPMIEDPERDCIFCRGRGTLANGSICPVCNGRVKVQVQPPAVRCAFCDGQGQMPPRSHLTCWVCNGKGFVPVTPPVQTCPDCQGRGKRPCESLYCSRCRGVGVVPASASGS
ncbi:MAG: hypothetical protein ABR964_06050 [Tepidisphaeraceae bacterium]